MRLTRRSFVVAVGTTTCMAASGHSMTMAAPANAAAWEYRYFDAWEARFIEAVCDRLIPTDVPTDAILTDTVGAGAALAGVAGYLDRCLAGPWGEGKESFRAGSWQPGSSMLAQRETGAPADWFRRALRALEPESRVFATWPRHRQDAWLRGLSVERRDLAGVRSESFFHTLLGMTVEGFFSDARTACTRDRLTWPLPAHAGACAILHPSKSPANAEFV